MDIKRVNELRKVASNFGVLGHIGAAVCMVELCDEVERLLNETSQLSEPIYAYRRLGQPHFATCDEERYAELSDNHLFETQLFYTQTP